MSDDKEEAKQRAERIAQDEKLYGKCMKICAVFSNDPDKSGVEVIEHSPHAWVWLWEAGVWTDKMICMNCSKVRS